MITPKTVLANTGVRCVRNSGSTDGRVPLNALLVEERAIWPLLLVDGWAHENGRIANDLKKEMSIIFP